MPKDRRVGKGWANGTVRCTSKNHNGVDRFEWQRVGPHQVARYCRHAQRHNRPAILRDEFDCEAFWSFRERKRPVFDALRRYANSFLMVHAARVFLNQRLRNIAAVRLNPHVCILWLINVHCFACCCTNWGNKVSSSNVQVFLF